MSRRGRRGNKRRGTNRSKKAAFIGPVWRDPWWESKNLAQNRTGSRYKQGLDAFECMECGLEWRCKPVEAFTEEGVPMGWTWPFNYCPRCEHAYITWLSFDIPVEDVYLSSEWDSGQRRWPGKIVVRRIEGPRALLHPPVALVDGPGTPLGS